MKAQHVFFGIVHDRGQFRDFGTDLIGTAGRHIGRGVTDPSRHSQRPSRSRPSNSISRSAASQSSRAESCGVRSLFHVEVAEVHHVLGHRWSLRSGVGVSNQTLPNIAGDHLTQDLHHD